MKTLVIINEPLAQMAVGKNSNLAYILSSLELGFETYLYDLSKEDFLSSKPSVIFLDPAADEMKKLILAYKELNFEISQNLQVGELISDFVWKNISLSDFDLVIQRLEPMKSPFPPVGKKDFNEILKEIKTAFPKLIINLPIDLSDKETPQEIDRILDKKSAEKIAIPTIEFEILDEEFPQIFFANKVVVKPKNAAQSFGIFAIEKSQNGLNLQDLKKVKITELANSQIHQIKDDLETDEMKQIIEILLCSQRLKTDQNILNKFQNKNFSQVTRVKTQQLASQLYKDKILLQPFLEGVKHGDIRSILLKNSNGDFYLAGHVFRQNINQSSKKHFTTCYSGGFAKASPISELTINEQKDLSKKCQKLLEILNGELREKYQDSLELGADFILVGNDKTLLLGELNHNCPALMPIAESLTKTTKNYDGGLFFIKKAISDTLLRQKSI